MTFDELSSGTERVRGYVIPTGLRIKPQGIHVDCCFTLSEKEKEKGAFLALYS